MGKAKIFAFLGIHNKRRIAVLKIWLFIINVGQGFRVWFTQVGLKWKVLVVCQLAIKVGFVVMPLKVSKFIKLGTGVYGSMYNCC